MNVLILDLHGDLHRGLADAVSSQGHAVVVSRTLAEGRRALETGALGLVFCNFPLYETGIASFVLDASGKNERTAVPCIIVAPAEINPGDEKLVMELGVAGILKKPVDPKMIFRVLDDYSSGAGMLDLGVPRGGKIGEDTFIERAADMLIDRLESKIRKLVSTRSSDKGPYYQAFHESSEGLLLIRDLQVVDANRVASRLTGYQSSELAGMKSEMLLPAAATGTGNTAGGDPGVNVFEFTMTRKDGSSFDAEVTMSHFRTDPGELCLALIRDVTTRKTALIKREQLMSSFSASQKMESLGRLAGGIAHDFNNALAGILGYTSIILDELPENFSHRKDIEAMASIARKAADLSRQVLAFSRPGRTGFGPVNVNKAANDVSDIIARTFDRLFKVETGISAVHDTVIGDNAQITHILMNLCINARDAMGGSGVIVIRTRNVTFGLTDLLPLTDARPGEYVEISVSDTGPGIPVEVQERMFEPFFTTKGDKGTGLGLSIVYGMVRNHEGFLNFDTEQDNGTVFRIFIPVASQSSPPHRATAPDAPAPAPIPGHHRTSLQKASTILLVDDEESMREIGRRILEKNGYEVKTASDGDEALELFNAGSGEIGLVILDLVMPRKNGFETLAQILELDPEARVLIATGSIGDEYARTLIDKGCSGVLFKPFDASTLVEEVRKIMTDDNTPSSLSSPGRLLKRILLVDDDPLILRTVERALKRFCDSVTANSAENALKILEGDRDFDFIISDMNMPEMSGLEFHSRVKAISPDISSKFLLMTGGVSDPVQSRDLEKSAIPTFEKPIDFEALKTFIQND
ncbi:MAG: response regulator [Myxococcota bacterium]|jgi:PAS domain S-box-containing protein